MGSNWRILIFLVALLCVIGLFFLAYENDLLASRGSWMKSGKKINWWSKTDILKILLCFYLYCLVYFILFFAFFILSNDQ